MSPLCVSPTLFSSESTYQRTPIAAPNLYGYNPFGFCPGEGSLPVPLVSPQPQPATATAWSAEHSSALYRVDGWGAPYFTINDNGNVAIRPHGAESLPSQEIDLTKIMKKVTDAKSHGGLGMRAPLIVRFPDILKHRLESLQSAFDTAIGRLGYESHYQGVYPVKCNQDRYVVENVVEFGSKFHFGLEAGSKPELLLAMASMCKASPEALLICNGYKDEEYVSLALNARLLGFNCVIVLEQEDELDVVLEASRRLSVRPVIGLRAKLRTKHGGHFGGTSGEEGKFGLTSTEIVSVLKKLKRLGMADCLKLLHFHIGSQIPTVDVLNDGATEAAFIYCELERMGADMKIIDIGGGLGIDYNGTKSESSDMSVAYTLEEYAFAVVRAVQAACRHKGVRCPVICSESGRALVSHHSLLLFDVLSVHEKSKAGTELLSELMAGMPAELVEDYRSIIIGENKICAEEMKSRCAELFKEGAISLEQLALADSVWDLMNPPPMSVCHINLSIFKSLPDCWAIGQVFPIMPIQRLNERPTVRAVLSDLTCDSDGKIHNFIDGEKGLAIHGQSDNPYYIGMFLGGAYQEALGGLHNLFGSPSVVHVRESDGPHCFSITRALPGQTSADVLRVMMHEPHQMFETLKSRIENAFIQSGFDGYDSETCNTAVNTLNTIAAAFDNIPYLSSSSCCSSSASGASSSDEFDEEDLDLNLW